MADTVLAECGATQRRLRKLPARVVVYLLLAATLFEECGYAAVWARLTAALGPLRLPGITATGLWHARARLGARPLRALFDLLRGPATAIRTAGARWAGLLVVAIDGTQVRLGPSRSDQLTVVAERKNERLEAKDPTQTELAISFRNEGRHPAKELSAIIRLDGMEFVPDEPALNLAGWAVNERTETGITAVQWDGGADCTIPPGFIRELPTLNLSDLHTIPEGVTFMWLKRYSIRKYRKSIRSRRRPMVDKPPEALIVVSIWEAASRAVTWQPVHFIVEEKETS
jgi:hypothetical protein